MSDSPAVETVPLADYARLWIDAALERGDAAAAAHPCPACEPCPRCVPIHADMARHGTAMTALQSELDELKKAMAHLIPQVLRPHYDHLHDAQRRAVAFFGAWQGAQQAADALGANPLVGADVSFETSRISLTPRPGWYEVDVGPALTMWVADPADADEARQLASHIESQRQARQAHQDAINHAHDMKVRYDQAENERIAAEAAIRAVEAEIERWQRDQFAKINDALAAWRAHHEELQAEFDRCLRECRDGHQNVGVAAATLGMRGALFGVAALAAGSTMVALGQPFDTGSPAESAAAAATLDEFTFEFVAVDPRYRTSFFAEPLDELGLFPGVLGDPIDVTGIGAGTLVFEIPLTDPVGAVLGGSVADGADLVFEPTTTTGVDETGVFLIGLEFDGDLLGTDHCDGRMIQFATSINNPAIPGLATDMRGFTGDYGQGANTIIRQEVTDCGSAVNVVDSIGDSLSFAGPSAVGGWIEMTAAGTSRYVGVIPASMIPDDSSFRSVYFEVESGGEFRFDNTRYQSTPDDLTQMIDVSTLPMPPWPTSGSSTEGDPDETDPGMIGLGFLTSLFGAATLGGGPGSRRRDDGGAEDDPDGGTLVGVEGAEIVVDPPPGPTAEQLTAATGEGRDEALRIGLERVTAAALDYVDAVRDRATAEAAGAEQGWLQWGVDQLTGAAAADAKTLAQTRAHERRFLDVYRSAVAEYVSAGLLTVAPQERAATLDELAATLPTDDTAGRGVGAEVARVIELDEEDRDRITTLAVAEAQLNVARFADEVVTIARTRVAPVGHGGTTPALVLALRGLESHVASTADQRVHRPGESEAQYRTREWFRDIRRTQAMASLIVVAERGTLVDPDGVLVDGSLRQEFVADRLAAVADDLDASSWRGYDTRSADAERLRSHLDEVYSALSFLGNGDADMPTYFRAVSAAIRDRQSDVNRWFVEEYLGLPVDDGGPWWDTIEVGWSVRLGTQGRTHGLGEESIEVVRSRIRRMNLEADRVVDALTRAASMPASELEAADVTLLGELGYLAPTPSGGTRYRMPVVDRTASAATRVTKPGASWLDVVSVQNAGEILVSVAVPELAAVRMSAIAARLGLSGRAIAAARFLTDQAVGVAIDVGATAIHASGDADLSRAALESVASSWAGMLANSQTESRLRKAFASERVKGVITNPATRRTLLDWTSTVFGVGNETLIGVATVAAQDQGLSTDDVLAALVSSAMNRTVGSVGRDVAGSVESGIARLPRHLREASIALAPTLEQARAVDSRLEAEAARRFDAVTGGRALDRTMGTRVFEALRLGELSWSELQRVYASRGGSLDTVMDQVRIDRDRFAQSIVGRARTAAVRLVDSHFDGRIAATQDPAERSRLESARRTELDKIDPTEGHDPGPSSRFAQKAVEIMSADRDEILRTFGSKIGEPGERSLDELRRAALSTVMTDVIQPGSAGATSDIDRSWASEWLRRGAQTVVEAEMLRGRIDSELPPTTATAIDTNEYVNVMARIASIIKQRDSFAGLDVMTVTVVRADDTTAEVTLRHDQAVEANSLASAMLHMHEGQRTRFEQNLLRGATAERQTELAAMFTHAHAELAASEQALRDYTAREAEASGTSANDPDTQLRARDRLYGDRLLALDALGVRIDAATAADRPALMSEWELAMNRALRDGIETYSDMANLDIIVSRMQSQKTEDGRKLTPSELMRSSDFSITANGVLSHLDQRQIRSMFNDQVLMIMHHVAAHRSGHESSAKATRSLAKYAERALLALNLLGRFHPDTDGPHKALFDATSRLMLHKDDPATLLRVLQDAAPRGTGSVAEALHWYLGEIESLPGLDGLTRGPAFVADGQRYTSGLALRDWLARSDTDQQASAVADLVATSLDLERLEALQSFAPADRHTATDLLESIANLRVRQAWLAPGSGHHVGDHRRLVTSELQQALDALDALRERGRSFSGVDAHDGVIHDLRARVDALRDRVGVTARR